MGPTIRICATRRTLHDLKCIAVGAPFERSIPTSSSYPGKSADRRSDPPVRSLSSRLQRKASSWFLQQSAGASRLASSFCPRQKDQAPYARLHCEYCGNACIRSRQRLPRHAPVGCGTTQNTHKSKAAEHQTPITRASLAPRPSQCTGRRRMVAVCVPGHALRRNFRMLS